VLIPERLGVVGKADLQDAIGVMPAQVHRAVADRTLLGRGFLDHLTLQPFESCVDAHGFISQEFGIDPADDHRLGAFPAAGGALGCPTIAPVGVVLEPGK
jgi:hypothetical protein